MNKSEIKKDVLTVPNLLSLLRIVLVPLFVWLYFDCRIEHHVLWAVLILVLSGLTDVLDGGIARRFHMISSFGKVIDPLADKLTQGAAVICISIRHHFLVALLILFCAKECTMLLASVHLLKMGLRPSESKWWGKLSTVVMFVFIMIVLLTDIFPAIPPEFVAVGAVITAICQLFSLFNYYPVFKEIQSGEYDIHTESKVSPAAAEDAAKGNNRL
ncbi:MAG: CDP-alcohol phosphatidyltransferase family protein [Acutalibacteraceae bacterium]